MVDISTALRITRCNQRAAGSMVQRRKLDDLARMRATQVRDDRHREIGGRNLRQTRAAP
jgi:hypothetical protein